MTVKQYNKGYVKISNGKVDITDPCYNKDVWCRMNDVSIKPGEYRCRYYMGADLEFADITETKKFAKEYGWDETKAIADELKDIQGRCFVIELQLKGRSFQLHSPKWEEIGNIGVDAGLAGFFWNKPDFSDDEWDEFCNKMDFSLNATPVYLDDDMGFWCQSGYGDGCYNVYAIKENNEIIALKICF